MVSGNGVMPHPACSQSGQNDYDTKSKKQTRRTTRSTGFTRDERRSGLPKRPHGCIVSEGQGRTAKEEKQKYDGGTRGTFQPKTTFGVACACRSHIRFRVIRERARARAASVVLVWIFGKRIRERFAFAHVVAWSLSTLEMLFVQAD